MSDASPLVSIVIPTYNHAHYLGEAIERLGQDAVLLEVIVVDDGSQDDPPPHRRPLPGRPADPAGQCRPCGPLGTPAGGPRTAATSCSSMPTIGSCRGPFRPISRASGPGPIALVYGAYRFIRADGSVRNEANFTEIGPDPFETFLRGNAIGMHATVMYSARRSKKA